MPSIEEIQRERAQLLARRDGPELRSQSDAVKRQVDAVVKKLNARPWVVRLLMPLHDHKEYQRLSRLDCELESARHQIEQDLEGLKRSVEATRHAQKRLSSAIKRQELADRRLEGEAHQQAEFLRGCSSEVGNHGFERSRFRVTGRGYNRGNSIDNWVRHRLEDTVLAAFSNRCLLCESREGLSFDHFAMPKNAGESFVLFVEPIGAMKLNVVVLCRSCNAAKGERPVEDLMRASTNEQAQRIHEASGLIPDAAGRRRQVPESHQLAPSNADS